MSVTVGTEKGLVAESAQALEMGLVTGSALWVEMARGESIGSVDSRWALELRSEGRESTERPVRTKGLVEDALSREGFGASVPGGSATAKGFVDEKSVTFGVGAKGFVAAGAAAGSTAGDAEHREALEGSRRRFQSSEVAAKGRGGIRGYKTLLHRKLHHNTLEPIRTKYTQHRHTTT